MSRPGTATVSGRGARRARRGHPWVYAEDVHQAGDAHPGEILRVLDRDGRFCCWAAWSPRSKIALRRVSRAPGPPDDAFWERRLEAALERRGKQAEAGAGCARLVHADAEGFPGFTADRYGEHLVIQATTVWAGLAAGRLVPLLARKTGCTSALARNDAAVRDLEGLPRITEQMVGLTPPLVVAEEAGFRREIDCWRGHKTGLYLDQQDNHRAAPGWLSGRILDLFAAEGGFAVPLAAAGYTVTAVDQSRPLLERGEKAAGDAGVGKAVEWVEANAFDYLADLERRQDLFDGIVLDPPPFARRRSEVPGAERGYRDLHRRALRCLRPGGRLLTFSCSFTLNAEEFESLVRRGAEEAEVETAVLGRPGPAADHPEVLDLPESRYLKGLLLARLG